MAVNTIQLKGVTTIAWGTLLALGSPAGALVESIRVTPKNKGPIGEVENGDGAGVTLALLKDGFDAEIEVVYDSAKTWPAEGDAINLTLSKVAAVGGTEVFGCGLVSYGQSKAKKKETMLTMSLVYRPGIAWT